MQNNKQNVLLIKAEKMRLTAASFIVATQPQRYQPDLAI